VAERKDLIRQVVQQIRVTSEGESERLLVSIDWVGGGGTTGLVIRPISRIERLSDSPELCERVRTLAGQGLDAQGIAEDLARAGYRPPIAKPSGLAGRRFGSYYNGSACARPALEHRLRSAATSGG
jgi:hypothetical protein